MEKNEEIKKLAQDLRKNTTKEERLLWNAFLRNYAVQFRRQCVFDRYLADFFCAKARLVVELDGSQHCESAAIEQDRLRTEYLESLGLQVLRFSNRDVLQHFDSVCQVIDEVVKKRFSPDAVPTGIGRRTFSSAYYTRVQSPHPPPSGAPSPPGGRVCQRRNYVEF